MLNNKLQLSNLIKKDEDLKDAFDDMIKIFESPPSSHDENKVKAEEFVSKIEKIVKTKVTIDGESKFFMEAFPSKGEYSPLPDVIIDFLINPKELDSKGLAIFSNGEYGSKLGELVKIISLIIKEKNGELEGADLGKQLLLRTMIIILVRFLDIINNPPPVDTSEKEKKDLADELESLQREEGVSEDTYGQELSTLSEREISSSRDPSTPLRMATEKKIGDSLLLMRYVKYLEQNIDTGDNRQKLEKIRRDPGIAFFKSVGEAKEKTALLPKIKECFYDKEIMETFLGSERYYERICHLNDEIDEGEVRETE